MLSTFLRSLFIFTLLCLCQTLPAKAQSDPPGRVGRISLTSGQVDFRDVANDWSRPALVNWPVVSGNVISTLRFARAEIQIGSTALRLEAETELEIKVLDDFHMVLRLHSGSVHVKVPNPDVAPQFELLTSQGRLQMQAPSQVRVDFSLRPDATSVRLFNGAVRFESNGAGLLLQPGQQLTLRQNEIATTNFTRDDFDVWSLALDVPQSPSTQYVSSEVTGHQDLDRHGDWQVSNEHGPIWYPRETPDNWAPYRHGSWTWIAPWGWTWVDHASWGYAPFHYGRWIWYRHRWAWVPGPRVERPVWSPAMVGWVHHHKGGGTVLGSHAHIGWYPLRPGEIYQPAYSSSLIYYRNVNGRLVGPGTTRRGHDDYHRHDRYGALTSLPQAQFTNNVVVVQPPKPAKPPVPPRNTIYEPPKRHATLNVGPIPPAQLAPGAPPAAPAGRNHPPRPVVNGENAGHNADTHSGHNPGNDGRNNGRNNDRNNGNNHAGNHGGNNAGNNTANNAGNNTGNNAASHGPGQYSGVTVTPYAPPVTTPQVPQVTAPQVTGPVRNTVTEPPRPIRPPNPSNPAEHGGQTGTGNIHSGRNTITEPPRQPAVPSTPPVRNTVIEGPRPVVTTHPQQPDPRQPAPAGTPPARPVVTESPRPNSAVQPQLPSSPPPSPVATPQPVRNTVREAPNPHHAAPTAPVQPVQPAPPVVRPQPAAPVQVAPPQPAARPATPPAEAKPAAPTVTAKPNKDEPRQPRKEDQDRR